MRTFLHVAKLMRCGSDGLNAHWLWWLYCSIILIHASSSSMLSTGQRDHRLDEIHYHHRTKALILMMGIMQDKVRGGSTPMSTPLFYSKYFDIRYDEFCFREGKIAYLSFILRCALEFGFVRVPQLHLLFPFLLP